MNFNNFTFIRLFPSSPPCTCCPPSPFQPSFIFDNPSPAPSIISSSNSENESSVILPLRSSSFDLSSLITKARWRREQFGEYIECVFCKANGEPYDIYSSHRLRDNEKKITLCPILRAHECPRCHLSGDQAHTMKYCPIKAQLKANQRMQEIQLAMKKN